MITQQRLHELFEYRDDGNLIRKVSTTNRVKVGDVAGYRNNNNGRYYVTFNKKNYLLHRWIFMYHHGYLTNGKDVDHIDGNPGNNRIENLREITHAQNLLNSKIYHSNTSGIKGVYWNKQRCKWQVQLSIKGKVKYLGQYTTLEEAKAVIEKARNEHHGDFARHN